MKVYDAAAIRNVAVVGHGGCGKTQLVSAMLFAAGAVNRLGRVDDGTTSPTSTTKRSPASTRSPPASPSSSGRRPRSTSSTPRASPTSCPTRAPRCASSKGRWSSSTRSPASKCRPRSSGPKPPRSTCRASSSSTASIASAPASSAPSSRCAATARGEIIPMQLPLGEERAFTGVIDLVRMKALTFAADGSGKMTEGDDSRGARRRAQQGARAADRDGRRSRRTADGDLLLRRAR